MGFFDRLFPSKPPIDSPASRLLNAWRLKKTDALAGELEGLDSPTLEEVTSKTWMAKARLRDPAWTPALLRTLFEGIEIPEVNYLRRDWAARRFAPLRARLDALAPLLPDPRVAAVLVDWLVHPNVDSRFAGLWVVEHVLQLVVAAGDPRQAPRLQTALVARRWKRQGFRDYFAEHLPSAIVQLSGEPFVARAPRREVDDATLAQLMDAVWASPKDDAPRLVLSDYLQECGSPQGEFISLQIRDYNDGLTVALARKMRGLEKQHREAWLGPVARTCSKLVFERGFLVEATLNANAAADPDLWTAAVSHPSLRLVRRLTKGKGNYRHYLAFLAGGQMLNLDLASVPVAVRGRLAKMKKAR